MTLLINAKAASGQSFTLPKGVIAIVIAMMWTAQFGLADDEAIGFSGGLHESKKFLTICADGNGSTRHAQLTVYEVLAPNWELRRLHSRTLVHQCYYTHCCLCAAGRFFITVNEKWWEEISYPLVIYDLVRNEESKYSLDELFTPNQLSLIRKTMGEEDTVGTAGFGWAQPLHQSEHHFDAKNLTFTIHGVGPWEYDNDVLRGWGDLPAQLGIEKPFVPVVIDLPTRVAKAITSAQTKDIREVNREGTGIDCVDQVSSDDAIYDKSKKRILLPRMIQVDYKVTRLTYKLDAETQEYVIVEPNDWQRGEIVRRICSAEQDKELRKRQADAIETAIKEDNDKQEKQ